MSNGKALRAAIRANPTDATVRLVFADWLDENDLPGGDLIRVLVNSSLKEAVPQVAEWFHKHHGWPMGPLNGEWMWKVLVVGLWPNPERLQECVRAIAQRMLPVAEHARRQFSIFERVVPLHSTTVLANTVIRAVNSQGNDETLSGGWVAGAAAYLAGSHLPGPLEPLHEEFCEQVHVVAWVWLALPPLHSARAVEASGATAEPPLEPRRPWWRRLLGG
jgi:uncharacterized protein (TIGR02996 family)